MVSGRHVIILLWLITLSVLMTPVAVAFEPFVVERIEFEGLERIERGRALNHIDLDAGDSVDPGRLQRAVQSLFRSGYFSDVQALRENNTLVFTVVERPAIASLTISGNRDIEDEDLIEGLRDIGIAQGRVFNQGVLETVRQELVRQYFANGKYGVEIDVEIEEREDNRVAISVVIDEGQVATIRQISVVGNEAFSDRELLSELRLRPAGLMTLIGSRDRYSQQQLSGDLEVLSSYYQNRGYINFSIESTQVSLSLDRRDIYITINVEEGEQFTISDVSVGGDMVLPEQELMRFVTTKPGEVFSREKATTSAQQLRDRMGNDGYAFAEARPIPDVDEDNRTVALTYVVESGPLVYVRNINFRGHSSTRDDVLRREMRQLESGVFSGRDITRSRTRLTRLPFIEDAEIDTVRVPGAQDLVDLDVEVAERSAGAFQLGFGYSSAQGALFNTSISHSNFMGSGNRVVAEAFRSSVSEQLQLSVTEPFYTIDGVSRTLSGFYRRSDRQTRVSSRFDSDVWGLSARFGIPLSEFNSLRLGGSYRNTELRANQFSPQRVVDWIEDNGAEYDTYVLETGFFRDTRNRTIFPDVGYNHRVSLDVTLPLSDIDYWSFDYRYQQMLPITEQLLGQNRFRVSVADAFGETTDTPPTEKFFGGGMESLRGFRGARVGPSEDGDAIGGNLAVFNQVDLILPAIGGSSTRFSFFVDAGYVYETVDEFDTNDFRASWGVAFDWLTPVVGLLRFSLAEPLREQPGDQTESFTFTFGANF